MKAKEVMTTYVHKVKPEDKVSKAVYLICRHNIAGLPVVDDQDKVVGVISEKDILKAMYPDYAQFHQDPISAMDFEKMEENFRDVNSMKVKEVMSAPPITATPDTPILKIGSLMILKRIRRVPIVDKEGKLLGIISEGDVHRSVFRCYLPTP
jgi:CBS domain-containing protein